MSSQYHAPAALRPPPPPWGRTTVLTEQETGWAPKPVWTIRRMSLALAGIRILDRTVRSQVNTPTTQSQIHAVVTNQQTNTASTVESGEVRTLLNHSKCGLWGGNPTRGLDTFCGLVGGFHCPVYVRTRRAHLIRSFTACLYDSQFQSLIVSCSGPHSLSCAIWRSRQQTTNTR